MAKVATKTYYGQCKCCLKETYLKNMWYTGTGQEEVYGQMLVDCFAIDWMIQGNIDDDKICEQCISKLRVAATFKNQVLKCQAEILEASKVEDIREDEVEEESVEEEEESFNLNGEQQEYEEEESSPRREQKTYEDVEFLEEEALDDETNDDNNQDYEPAAKKLKWPKKLPPSERNKLYMQYSEEDLKNAVKAVKERKMNTVTAAKTYNIPRKTISKKLYDNTDGGQIAQQKPEPDVDSVLCKHRENMRSILVASNATPIKGHWGFGYACFFCPKQFEEPDQLKQHTFTHGALIPSIKVKSLAEHIVKLDVTHLKCNICDMKIKALDDLMVHLKEIHDMLIHLDIPNHIVPFSFEGSGLKCVKCPLSFSSFKDLSEHMNDAHFRNYECSVCRRGFVNVRFLKTHSIAHGINIFPCVYCLRIFDSRTEMVAHEKVHLKNRMRKTTLPDEKLPSEIENAKPKLPEITFSSFVKKVARDVQRSNCKSEHKCKGCPKIYESRSDLLYHINLVHKPHKCTVCNNTFDFQFMLKKHMLKEHSSSSYGCPKCSKTFASENLLKKHMQEHSTKEYCCEVCCCQFSLEDSYMTHMKDNHGLE